MPTGGSKPGGPQSKHLKPRYGNGRGHGGEAKGAAVDRPEAIHNPATAATQNPSGLPGYRAMAKAERIEKLKEMLWTRANESERDADQIAAINSLLNREDGLPVQKIVTPESAPEWFIEGTVELSEDEWTRVAALASTPARGHAD